VDRPIQRQSSAAFGPRYFVSKGRHVVRRLHLLDDALCNHSDPSALPGLATPDPHLTARPHRDRQPTPRFSLMKIRSSSKAQWERRIGSHQAGGSSIRRSRARRCRQGSRPRTAAAPSPSLQRCAAAGPADTGGLMVINASVEGAANSMGHPSCGASPASARREQSPHPGSDPR